jgi:hypothetical protein
VKTASTSALVQASMCFALAGCALSPPADVPASLRVPSSQVLMRQLHAKGAQIYQCQPAKSDATRFEWSLKAPEANLFNSAGSNVGKHYAGPAWEGNDGSKVVGEVLARWNSPAPNAIPWLLLSARATPGKGIFSGVTAIQRLHTVGGAAPAGGCSHAQLGQELRAAYSADYLFYAARH